MQVSLRENQLIFWLVPYVQFGSVDPLFPFAPQSAKSSQKSCLISSALSSCCDHCHPNLFKMASHCARNLVGHEFDILGGLTRATEEAKTGRVSEYKPSRWSGRSDFSWGRVWAVGGDQGPEPQRVSDFKEYAKKNFHAVLQYSVTYLTQGGIFDIALNIMLTYYR